MRVIRNETISLVWLASVNALFLTLGLSRCNSPIVISCSFFPESSCSWICNWIIGRNRSIIDFCNNINIFMTWYVYRCSVCELQQNVERRSIIALAFVMSVFRVWYVYIARLLWREDRLCIDVVHDLQLYGAVTKPTPKFSLDMYTESNGIRATQWPLQCSTLNAKGYTMALTSHNVNWMPKLNTLRPTFAICVGGLLSVACMAVFRSKSN
jgi:hypothetical protein